MDSFTSQREDGSLEGMSMSLVSYGSDLDASLDDSISNLKRYVNKTLTDHETDSFSKTMCDSVAEISKTLSVTGLSDKKQKELQQAMNCAAIAQREYLESSEVLRALKNVIGPDTKLPQPLVETIQKMLLREGLKDYIVADKNCDIGVLGLKDEQLSADCPELSVSDQKVLRLAVESQIIKTARDLKQTDADKQEILKGRDPDSGNCIEGDHTVQVASLRTELNKELSNYYKQLVRLDSLLESIVQLRTNEMNADCVKTIDSIKLKAQVLKQRAQCANAQIMSAIYTEDEHIAAALQRLERELDLLYSETQAEYMSLTALRAAYERVEGQQFDKILEEYRLVRKQLKVLQYTQGQYDV